MRSLSIEKVRALRGKASHKAPCQRLTYRQTFFRRPSKGAATDPMISGICKYAAIIGQNLMPEDLKNKLTAKSRGN